MGFPLLLWQQLGIETTPRWQPLKAVFISVIATQYTAIHFAFDLFYDCDFSLWFNSLPKYMRLRTETKVRAILIMFD